jgi:hypothetical protein
MGRVTRRQQIIVPNNYWESSINVKWVSIDA